MLALEPVRGVRVVAQPRALDAVAAPAAAIALRFAPDDLLLLDAEPASVDVADPHAIVEEEAGFVGCWLTPDDLGAVVVPHLEWPLPVERPALAQGLVAGVPSKLWLSGDRALLLVAAAYGHELAARVR